MNTFDFGIVGLGVMGRNLLLNIASQKFAAAGLDLDTEKVNSLQQEADSEHTLEATTDVKHFVELIKRPRAIMLLVPAGKPVDSAIQSLLPHLDEGDIIIDGGNTYFTDTDRRFLELSAKGIHFFGMGISGGEQGARFGPSMMPGGDKKAYERLRPIFEAIAAKVDGEPCVEYLGNGSAGNYVKMVHNGIEYGIMQLISEIYDLMKRGYNLDEDTIENTFNEWNQTDLKSFLIEITGAILKVKEPNGERLINLISDWAKSKGTGKWTSQNAMDLQVPVPTIDAAVFMRDMSKSKPERIEAATKLVWNDKQATVNAPEAISALKDALFFSILITYAQGLAQLKTASKEYNYELNLETVTKIWRGGCIIRADVLEDFRKAFATNPNLPNILLDTDIAAKFNETQAGIREVIQFAVQKGLPVAGLMNSLAYFDSYRSENLPTNMIQAQRDYFGAHTYERTDLPGTFHTQWND
ncbi:MULTISPECIES: NADP-dependent phosphogluconate dehydrogenase [unclassified Flavobacterium]|uniref:NADP-dependent phosphogluconate dehydrogenase n=1 Tax=unclassified Flavobacterium TaxID=196869 RepID=UPI000F0C2473|nr:MULTISPECIES: NADP-dependent phosphogluconate dehydrogenase [unclassified Flavobacterium]AYN04256.1 NADP-dependent phosphogluconate dehydrogenase [Flavobacterium sp. 140616W15]MCD0476217.1 NADP-dependent phosphogluconate dehydrogenase [Flavobacterium sp. EDS]